MRKTYESAKYIMVISLFIIYGACATRKSEPITGAVVDRSDARVANGQEKYNRYCQKCHPAGEAGLGPAVNGKPNFLKKFQAKHGLGVMPAFKDIISEQDIKDIGLYMKQLDKLKKRKDV
jgi:mono/diheme cytochrome c family protein